MDELEILRPDDWHLHVRDGAVLKATLPATAAVFARAIIMPNLVPPVRTLADLRAYRDRIVAALPQGHRFQPLMTLYLTEQTDPAEIRAGAETGDLVAVKLYPAGATTNSESGVRNFDRIDAVLEAMQAADVPLLLHGEVTDPDVDVFDREAVFIERVLDPLRRRHPGLRIVLEHASTQDAVDYVRASDANLGATITPHHLMINRNALFRGGLRPHMYCLPVAKRERHRRALRQAATSGDPRFFFGTDSAPHPVSAKESDCGCAGIYNAPVALPCAAQVFEEENALGRLERFVSLNGAAFYRLTPNVERIKLVRRPTEHVDCVALEGGAGDQIRVFDPDSVLRWSVDKAGQRLD